MDEAVCKLVQRAGPSIGENYASRDLRKTPRLDSSLVSPHLACSKDQGHVNCRPSKTNPSLSCNITNIFDQLPCVHPFQVTRFILEILSSGGLESAYLSQIEPPLPSYNDSVADLPPSYDLKEDLASDQLASKRLDIPPTYDYTQQSIISSPEPMTAPDIDFGDISNFRQAAGKKAKKAAKQASQAKWADDGDGGSKDGGDGEENGEGGGGGGGGSNGGDGGGGDGGGGGDDWDDWDTGKNKKKGKKAKDDEKKKQEEEEAKKKEEEEAAKNNNPLSWADEGNDDAGDDWGGFTTTTKKDKKGKKGKVCLK